MPRGHTKFLQRRKVRFCRVARIFGPSIGGKLLRQIHHQPIARDFCNDRCRRNRQRFGIALYNRRGGYGQPFGNKIAINQRMIWRARQSRKGALHRQMAGAQNIKIINFLHAGMGHANIGAGHNGGKQRLAPPVA